MERVDQIGDPWRDAPRKCSIAIHAHEGARLGVPNYPNIDLIGESTSELSGLLNMEKFKHENNNLVCWLWWHCQQVTPYTM